MDALQIERLLLRLGAPVGEREVRLLEAEIAQQTPQHGRGVRHVLPWGYHPKVSGRSVGADAPVFEPEVTIKGNAAEVRWTGPRAQIGGLVPKIGATEIFSLDPATQRRPAVTFTVDHLDPDTDEGGIYFELKTGPTFFPISVTAIAAPRLPPPTPYTAHKLALHIRRRGGRLTYQADDDRELFSSQGFLAINQRSSGIFEPLWLALF